ncbi:MAG: formate dehydrogenase subunit alpha [Gammaproteobacteria bacterium RIFCSPLOWO2_02_FULL_47_50]|nr:MAG: formate dehydrogenase subunit alpha [Gammaproteobacteria bacterium RIFCSPLOWO2_12_47_11]OGT80634.1 MAG: formate dehydrogenase subunit alpha [Gammaproteobacteria bacterium RIFCSPLOWO2_02_FULL_47_50]OGT87384.1 MAG: formate dehydrogenase subunit alpha [Gammaproteobacteria bacterium RIFCSPLOWO2_12_FULL_47_76]
MAANPEYLHEKMIKFTLNGEAIDAFGDETILETARRHGIEIPTLCYLEGYRPDGNCRACMVEIKGERVLAPACCRKPTENMEVSSDNERALHSQKMVIELLLADMPQQGKSPYKLNSELDQWVNKFGIYHPRFHQRKQPRPDLSHPAMAVNLDACIQCTRCVRACREEQVNDVIGYAFRGSRSEIVFDMGEPMGESTCVGCGECVQACPTGALMPAKNAGLVEPDKKVESVCPYCGVGCLLTFNVKNNFIQYVDGRDGPSNHGRLCVKGRYGFDYVHHSDRLTTPLIRKTDAVKTPVLIDPLEMHKYFREASWDEALDFAATGLRSIRENQGPQALAGFGCAKGSNEEAYLFQKLVRTGFGTNNVDHCTRLCHASSVAALLETIGSGAVSNQVADGTEAEVILLVGARPNDNHPVAATFMKNAAERGSKLIIIEPYSSEMYLHASHMLKLRPGTDVLLLNGMIHTIITEDLHNKEFIEQHTDGFEALKKTVEKYPPEKVAPLCGIPPETIKEVARIYATAKTAIIFWGMGISQHIHGTDNARCLISLALMTGQIGRPSTGLHPLRGQNNVQGASDVGLIPMVYPDYQPVESAEVRKKFEALWGTKLDPNAGKTVVEIMHAIHGGELNGLYIMGENPAMSDPNLNHAREALAMLDHLVVQDIFFTETCSYADVILPASAFPEKTGTFTNTDRRVQLGRQAINPPGDARQDLWIIQEIANRMGLDWDYSGPADVFAEIRQAVPSLGGMTWERLEEVDSLTYPLTKEGDPGQPIIFKDGIFPTDDGKGRFVPVDYIEAAELPDNKYPYIFVTGRQLEHWHTGTMTRHSRVLDAIEPGPCIMINPADLDQFDLKSGDMLVIESRRGRIAATTRADEHMQKGVVMMPFTFSEAAANLISNDALDPFGKIPEFKFCAVRLKPGQRADDIIQRKK